jgi:peroxisomal enoyl-CoA hydratase 2
MILEQEMVLIDALTSTTYAKLTSTAFGIGQGGYGGPKGPTIKLSPPPSRNPDYIHNYQTTEGQALLYRLNGDYNPMHASEEYGKQAGFKGSILQGLGTWNIVAHGVLEKVGGSDEKRFRSFGARFKSVVYPGDELETKIWVTGEEEGCEVCVFETRVKSDEKVALSNGTAKILIASVISKL